MSVMIINKEYLERIGKYMSLTMSEQKAKELCLEWHVLNLQNFAERYKEHGEYFDGPEIEAHELDFSEVAIPASVQVVSDLKALYYNCIDYGKDINERALNELERTIERVENSQEYKLTRHFAESVKY